MQDHVRKLLQQELAAQKVALVAVSTKHRVALIIAEGHAKEIEQYQANIQALEDHLRENES